VSTASSREVGATGGACRSVDPAANGKGKRWPNSVQVLAGLEHW